MTQPVYATREDVMRALDSKPTARNAAQIDRALASASRTRAESSAVTSSQVSSWCGGQGRPWTDRLTLVNVGDPVPPMVQRMRPWFVIW